MTNDNQQMTTEQQYEKAIGSSKKIFLQKTKDYGTSWRVYRTISVADQLYIKAKRIKTIQELGKQRIDENVISEFMGILNYAIIGLIQLDINDDELEELPVETVEIMYNEKAGIAKNLMLDKNHDYGEAWRAMSQESFVDLILAKILRIKQILMNQGQTIVSEGIDANYYDIINYAAFGLILIEEKVHSS